MKPKETDFEPHTLGEHLRKRRLEMKRTQKELAGQLGVNPWTILNWEKTHTEPPIGAISVILRFLGYDPFPQPRTLSQKLLAKRRRLGWSIKEAANQVRVDPSTWAGWERGHTVLYRKHHAMLARLLEIGARDLDEEMALAWGRSHG